MAEYVEVMKQKRRMCNSYALCSIGCPLYDTAFCDKNSGEKISADFPEVERRIMAWAAEHPEPVYETWFEYLLRIGVIPENAPAGGEYQWIVESIKHKHISNDIAESLKLHPKEV